MEIMALLNILIAPDPRLKIVAKPVASVDDSVRKIMDDMLETMYVEEGAGLAATQVGIDKRIVVMDIIWDEGLKRAPLKMANPEILWHSKETSIRNEGCLSVPGQRGEVERPSKVKVRYLDDKNTLVERDADGDLAVCIQHEIDHLNGKLYIDYFSTLKQQIILRKLKKYKSYE
jgi:peptide deformylase